MADVSLSRAIADESLGRKIGRGIRTAGDAVDQYNPLNLLKPLVTGEPIRNFFGEIGQGLSGATSASGPKVNADEEDRLAPLTPGIELPQAPEPPQLPKAPSGDTSLMSGVLDLTKNITPIDMGVKPTDKFTTVTNPTLPAVPKAPRLDNSFGRSPRGGVFGAMANVVNDAGDAYNAIAARRASQRDFTNQVAAATANAGNYDKLYDAETKRATANATLQAAGLKAGIDSLKNMKELQQAQVIATRRKLLQPHIDKAMEEGDYAKVLELSASLEGHNIPDQIVNFPAGVGPDGKPIPAAAVSARYGTALSQSPNGVLVDAVKDAGSIANEGKIMQDPQTKQRYMIKNGQKIPF